MFIHTQEQLRRVQSFLQNAVVSARIQAWVYFASSRHVAHVPLTRMRNIAIENVLTTHFLVITPHEWPQGFHFTWCRV